MKLKKGMFILLGISLLTQLSYSKEDAAMERLLKLADKRIEAKKLEAERIAKEEEAKRLAEEKRLKEEQERKIAEQKRIEEEKLKNMTDSEKMDLEVKRIKKRMIEINSNIKNYEDTEKYLNQLEQKVENLQMKVK